MESAVEGMDATEEEIRNLYHALDERDRHIEELEAELERGPHAEIHAEIQAIQEENDGLSSELDKTSNELLKCHDTISELQGQIKQLKQENECLVGEKSQLEDQVRTHKTLLDAQKSRLAEATKSSENVRKQQKDDNQHFHRLEVENQRLRDTILEVEENEEILVKEVETLVGEKSELQEKNDELSSKVDSLYAIIDHKTGENSSLLEETKKLQDSLEVERATHSRNENKWKQIDASSKLEITRLTDELAKQEKENQLDFISQQRDSLQKELVEVKRENQSLLSEYNRCVADKKQAETDLDSTIRALHESKVSAKEQVALAVRKEQASMEEIKTKLVQTAEKEKSFSTRCLELEGELEEIQKQLEKSETRNSWYEKKHGLTDAVRYQQKLEADIRRRDYDLKQANHSLAVEIDKKLALSKACEWLKERANLGADVSIDDEDIQLAIQNDSVHLQNSELLRQVETLEEERTKLLTQLRSRAIEIGQKGIRFLGMQPDQVAKVMEFAGNLKEGKVELPLNDRSMELMSQISSLKAEKETDKVTIERLEREVFSLSHPTQECVTSNANEVVQTLKQALDDMSIQNQELMERLIGNEANGGGCLTPYMQEKAKQVLGENLVPMPANAQVQFACLLKAMTENPPTEVGTSNVKKCGTLDNVSSSQSVMIKESAIENLEHPTAEKNGKPNLQLSIERFRRCARSVHHQNSQLRLAVSKLEKMLQSLAVERDALRAQIEKSDEKCNSAEVIKLTVKCKKLENELEKETERRKIAEQDAMEFMGRKRVLYLEEWKANAMEVIERQLRSLESSVNVSTYMQALKDLDAVKRDNLLLVHRTADLQICVLKYRDVCKSLANEVDSAKSSTSSSIPGHDKFKSLMDENCLLWERTVASDEREQLMRQKVADMMKKCAETESKYSGGMTAAEARTLKESNDELKSELVLLKHDVSKYKKTAEISVTTSKALLAKKKKMTKDFENGCVFSEGDPYQLTQQLEIYDEKLTRSSETIERLQQNLKSLVLVIQRVANENWLHLFCAGSDASGLDSFVDIGHDSEIEKETNFVSKMSLLGQRMDSLQKEMDEKDEALHLLNIENEALKAKLECLGKPNQNSAVDVAKFKNADLKRKLRKMEDQIELSNNKIQRLEKMNAELEDECAKAQLSIHCDDSRMFQKLFFDDEQHTKHLESSLKRAHNMLSEYKGHIVQLCSAAATISENRVVSTQLTCFNDMIREKNRQIEHLTEKMKQQQTSHIAAKKSNGTHSDDSVSTIFDPVCTQTNQPSEKTLQLIQMQENDIQKKDQQIANLSQMLAASKEAHKCESQRCQDSMAEAENMKSDIKNLLSRLASAGELATENEASRVKISKLNSELQESKQALDALEKDFSKLKLEFQEKDTKLGDLEKQHLRTSKQLTSLRQVKSKVELREKDATEKLQSASKEVMNLRAKMDELKEKALNAQNEKVKARRLASKLKELNGESRGTNEEEKIQLQKRVDALNSTTAKLAKVNSKLRCELAAYKSNKSVQSAMDKNSPKEQALFSAKCNNCISLKAQIDSLKRVMSAKMRGEFEEEKSNSEERAHPNEQFEEKLQTELKHLRAEKFALHQENTRLSKQLQSNDLDLFEEIEDLKLKYNEAVRQLNQMSHR